MLVTVLTMYAFFVLLSLIAAGFWPTYKSMDLALPSEMVEGINAFKEFYEAETKHRKLTWVYTQVCLITSYVYVRCAFVYARICVHCK